MIRADRGTTTSYLIRHEKGLLLWDGGLPASAAEAEGKVKLEGGTMSYDRYLVDQLADMGIAPADVTHAAFSHLHFDLAGSANSFTQSNILMQRSEWDAAFGKSEGYVDATLFDKLEDAKRTMLDGDYDIFGDGSVRLIYTPGHTPGHQALFVALEQTGPIVLSGDLYHFRENRTLRRAPKFNFDAEMTLESMDKVEAFLATSGATLWIEHDKALADTLKKAPLFYD